MTVRKNIEGQPDNNPTRLKYAKNINTQQYILTNAIIIILVYVIAYLSNNDSNDTWTPFSQMVVVLAFFLLFTETFEYHRIHFVVLIFTSFLTLSSLRQWSYLLLSVAVFLCSCHLFLIHRHKIQYNFYFFIFMTYQTSVVVVFIFSCIQIDSSFNFRVFIIQAMALIGELALYVFVLLKL